MFLGAGTGHILQVVTSAAGSVMVAGSLVVTDNANPPVVQGSANTGPQLLATITTAATTAVVTGVASRLTRVDELTVYNNSATVVQTITVQRTDGTNTPKIITVTLLPGETLLYSAPGMWTHLDANGGVYGAGTQIQASAVMVSPFFSTANLTTAKTITSTNTFALYVGRLTRATSSVQVRLRVSTAAATITWAEVAIAKGSINPGGNPTLTVVGFADVSASYNSTGQKTTTVNVSSGQTLNAGDDLWFLIGNQATTAAAVRAASIADDIQSGMQASAIQRPSLIVGTATAFTIEGATATSAWVAVIPS